MDPSRQKLIVLKHSKLKESHCHSQSLLKISHRFASITFLSPASDNNPAEWNALAIATCRSPIVSLFFLFTDSGINSRLAITFSSSGAIARGMM